MFPPATNPAAAYAGRAWNATWPKLLAIAIVIGGWQSVVWHARASRVPRARRRSPCSTQMYTTRTCSPRRCVRDPHTRGAQGFVLATLIGGAVGIAVARVKILRAAIGSMITGLQTMPSVAWVPLAIILFHEGAGMIMFVVVLGAAPSIANGIIEGIDHVPP